MVDPAKGNKTCLQRGVVFEADLKRKTFHSGRATEAEETAWRPTQGIKQPGAFMECRLAGPAGIRPWGAYKDTGRTLEQREAMAGYCTGWLEGPGCASWRRNGSSDLFLSALWAEGADETAALGPTVEIE